MASGSPIPDPQLQAILDTLKQVLVYTTASYNSSVAPQLNIIIQELKDILAAVKAAPAASSTPAAAPSSKSLSMPGPTPAPFKLPEDPMAGGGPSPLAVLGQLTAVITGVLGALLTIVAVTQSFVQALDPGLVEQFGRAIKDLQATIGVAFVGIFEQGMNFLRDLSAAIQPVFVALKPVVDQLVGVVLKGFQASLAMVTPILLAVVPILKVFTDLIAILSAILRPLIAIYMVFFQVFASIIGSVFGLLAAALDPLVKLLDAVMDGFQDMINMFSVILRVLFDMLNAFIVSIFGGSFEDLIKQVTNAFHELIKTVVLAAARLALMAGNSEFVTRLRDALNQKGQMATGSTSIKSLEQIGKDMATASVNAAGVESAKDATNADIIKALDELIKENKTNTDSTIAAIVRNATGSETAGQFAKVGMNPVGYVSAGAKDALGITSWNPF